jgi:glutathione reductase (NADPH)
MEEYVKIGIDICCCGVVSKVTKSEDGKLKMHVWNTVQEKEIIKEGYEKLIFAVGRSANTESLNLSAVNVAVSDNGFISVNEFQETNVENIYAVGDVCGSHMLTPGKPKS